MTPRAPARAPRGRLAARLTRLVAVTGTGLSMLFHDKLKFLGTVSGVVFAVLLHLGYNMWCDRERPDRPDAHTVARPYMRFYVSLWNDLAKQMASRMVEVSVRRTSR